MGGLGHARTDASGGGVCSSRPRRGHQVSFPFLQRDTFFSRPLSRLAAPPSTSGRPARPALPARPLRRATHTTRPRSLFRGGGGGGGGFDPDSFLPGGGGGGGGRGDDGKEEEPPSSLLSPRRRPLEVESIPRPILERVEVAVEAAGGRVTAGDVSAAAGVPLRAAEAALNALAADTAGRLQVSPSGDLAYVLPPNFRVRLRSKSAWLRLAPRIDAVAGAVGWAGRVAFGGALLLSLALAAAALVALSVAASSSSDDRDRGRGRGGGGGFMPMSFWFSPGDFLFWFDPYGYRRARRSVGAERGGGRGNAGDPDAMGFLESVFSFVFGDGDPNLTYDDDRWRAAGRAIGARGGVVAAEELAPFLDLPAMSGSAARDADGDGADDEAWVLPALVRFNGRAEVDDEGRLLYVFPDLQKTAGGRGSAAAAGTGGGWGSAFRGAPSRESVPALPPTPALEAPIPFTRASSGQRLASAGLGAANIAVVTTLASALAERGAAAALAAQGLGFILPLMPWLQAYAAAFFLIPAARWAWNGRLNTGIAARNEARAEAANILRAPGRALAGKLGAARARAETVALRPDEAVFDSGVSTGPEAAIQGELADFDAKLGGGGKGRPF